MNVIHFGDIHVWRLDIAWNDLLYPKRYLGGLNLLLNRRKKFPPELGATVVQEILKREADLVVFSGDMTTTSLKSEFKACAELFAPLREKWGARFFVIPGNHDRYTPRSVKQGLYETYFPYGLMDEHGLRFQEIDEQRVVIGFDASRPFMIRSNGFFSEGLNIRLRTMLEEQTAAGKQIILSGHFPANYPENVPVKWDHELLQRDRLQTILRDFPDVIYLHGHKHIRWRVGNQVNCGAAGMQSSLPNKQAGFVELDLSENGLESVTGFALRDDLSGFDSFDVADG